MAALPSDEREMHEFVGETRAKLASLEQGQRDLWAAMIESRNSSTLAHEALRASIDEFKTTVDKRFSQLAQSVAGINVKVALGAAVLAVAGSAIAGLIVKLA